MNEVGERKPGFVARNWRLFLLFFAVAFVAGMIGEVVDSVFHTTIGWYFALPCCLACGLIVQGRRQK